MKYYHKLFVLLITLFLTMTIFGGVNLAANGPKDITISTIDITLMPEYDTPDLLEVNTVTMVNNSDKPFQGELVWRLPKGAVNAVVVKSEDVNATKVQSLGQVRSGQQYDELYWTPSEAIPAKGQKTWHIEYYNPTVIQGTTDKTFTYNFQQPYVVSIGNIAILQPTKATNFKTEPAPGNQQSTQEGNMLIFPINNTSANQAVKIKASYTKTDPSPSFSNNQAQSGQEQTQGTQPAPAKNNKTILFALIALIIIIAAAAIIVIMKNNVNNERQDIIKKRVARKSSPDFYDDIDEFEESDDIDELDAQDALEESDEIEVVHINVDESNSSSDDNNYLVKAKQDLRRKLEKGQITEVDYYEKLAELEE